MLVLFWTMLLLNKLERIGKCLFSVHRCVDLLTKTLSRVRVNGIRGYAPPPTTKLAVFYPGGFEAQILLNATGYGTEEKWDLIERQLRHFIANESIDRIHTLEFQR